MGCKGCPVNTFFDEPTSSTPPTDKSKLNPEDLMDPFATWNPGADLEGFGTEVDVPDDQDSGDSQVVAECWNGSFWDKTTLNDLGFIIQFGHAHPDLCFSPSDLITLTVLDCSGIHKVAATFCGCPLAMLASKRAQMLQMCWFPATVVEPQTCVTFRLLEQFHQLNLNGCLNVHEMGAALERQTDATALEPIPDRYKPGFSCVFRQWAFLKHMKRAGRGHDPLGPSGTKPGECAVNYVTEADILTCIVFATLTQKETRLTTCLHSSGVAACICARHKVVGEHGLHLSLIYYRISISTVVLSYGIACQYHKNLNTRMEKMPEELKPSSDLEFKFVLPSWHTENSISYHMGVGRTDGKGIERGWAEMNPLASSMKEMGIGARQDTLDNHFGDRLSHKLIIALDECQRQVDNFREVTNTLKCDTVKQWKDMIAKWESDKKKYPNPFEVDRTGMLTEAEVRLQLRNKELKEIESGGVPLHETSATAFLVAGFQLEDHQQRIQMESTAQLRTANQMSILEDKWISFLSKLHSFRDLQRLYMPGAVHCIQREERLSSDTPVKAGNIKLWMPSDLPVEERDHGCVRGLAQMEIRLREAQCSNALETLRSRLYAKAYLINFRNKNTRGQVQSTRSRTLINHVGDRVSLSASKYRRARAALMALCGSEFKCDKYKELKPTDLQ
ncbi:hypothetical protein BJ138DRAFT_1106537, partial [Hygrophoropsis aurantiaca]